MKKLRNLFVFAAMLLCSTSILAHDFVANGVYYNIKSAEDRTVEVTCAGKYYDSNTNEYYGSVTIPKTVTYRATTYDVVGISDNAFRKCQNMSSVSIPNSVSNVGSLAFADCSGLTSVIITDLAAWCGISFADSYSNPLYYSKLLYLNGEKVTDLVVPNDVTSIGGYTFSGYSGLVSVELHEGVTSIGNSAFSGCTGLTSIKVPENVESIGRHAFQYCI